MKQSKLKSHKWTRNPPNKSKNIITKRLQHKCQITGKIFRTQIFKQHILIFFIIKVIILLDWWQILPQQTSWTHALIPSIEGIQTQVRLARTLTMFSQMKFERKECYVTLIIYQRIKLETIISAALKSDVETIVKNTMFQAQIKTTFWQHNKFSL